MNIPLNVQPTDCDTCGRSYDELEIAFDDDGEWAAYLSLGCYGGGSYKGNREGLVTWLRENVTRIVDPDDLDRHIRLIEEA